MIKNINKNIWVFGLMALIYTSCKEDSAAVSTITIFGEYPIVLSSTTPAIVANELDENTYSFTLSMDERQIRDIVLVIANGDSSSATEDVDFELSTHEIEIPAFAGQDSVSFEISVLQDFEIEEQESVYVRLSSEGASGLEEVEILLLTIEDSGLTPLPASTIDFGLRWVFADPLLASTDVCTVINDLDFTIQTVGGEMYDDDLLEFALATTSCPENGTLDITTMTDGEVYEVWFAIYGGVDLGDAGEITAYLDFEREHSEFNGTIEIEGVFDANMAAAGGVLMTIEKNGDVITLRDSDGNELAEGRVRGGNKKLQNVNK